MKKCNLFISILLFATYLIGCKKSDSSDLHLLELKGNVESVTTFCTTDVTQEGKRKKTSKRLKRTSFLFDKKGKILSGYDYDNLPLEISRSKSGNIDKIELSCEKYWEKEVGYCFKFLWNENGYPVKIHGEYCYESSPIFSVIYDSLYNVIACLEEEKYLYDNIYMDEPEERTFRHPYFYEVESVDSHGNWVKRLEICYYPSQTIFNLHERVIKYYD